MNTMFRDKYLDLSGDIQVKKNQRGPGLRWRLRNLFTTRFLMGWFFFHLAKVFSALTGIPTLVGELKITLIRAKCEPQRSEPS